MDVHETWHQNVVKTVFSHFISNLGVKSETTSLHEYLSAFLGAREFVFPVLRMRFQMYIPDSSWVPRIHAKALQ
jgi:hypothetical protein